MEHLARHRATRWDCASVILCSLLSPRVVPSFTLSLSHRSPPTPPLRVFFRNRFPLGDTDEARNWIWVNRTSELRSSTLSLSLSGLDGLARLYIRNEIHIFLELFIFAARIQSSDFSFFLLKVVEMISMIRVKLSN